MKSWKGILAGVLAMVMVATALPIQAIQVAGENSIEGRYHL